ncbi:adenosylcobinamide-GDP ribazoletransferase [Luedemannella helvata]|uniref:Adenosylcobinamide-GDP ribazoletransferase n=1 Tax=Luedemannella helvata TaxID=349315 RepID=A0ABP4W211_9ACTN
MTGPTPPDRPSGAGTLRAGFRLAVTTLTVLPLRPGRIDRPAAGAAMALAPGVGLALGAVAGAVGAALVEVGANGLLAGVLVVAFTALATRGLHLDGLADTVDGLGSHRPAAQALEIMKRPDVGAFGAAALVLTLLAQAASAAAVVSAGWLAAVAGVAAALGAGRLAIATACRRGVPPARPDGLGALAASTVGWPALSAGALAVAAVAVWAVPGRPWAGPLAVMAGLVVSVLLTAHCVRRFGGVTGDVLGGACEAATTFTYIVLSICI